MTDIHRLAAAYALNALDDDETEQFQAHLAHCDACQIEVSEFAETAAQLAESAASPAPPHLRDRVLAEVSETRQLPPVEATEPGSAAPDRQRRRVAAPSWVLAAAASVALIALGFAAFGRSEPDPIDELVEALDAVTIDLDGSAATSSDTIQVVWSPGRQEAAVLADNLPVLPADQAYELWFLLPDGVSPAGLFTPDSSGVVRAFLEVDDAQPTGWGVTVEPASGSLQPTSEVILAGMF